MARWRSRYDPAFVRYLGFQVPEWMLVALLLYGVHHYTDAPPWLLVLAGAAFAGKDLALYPWMRRAYEKAHADPGEDLVGRRGVAVGDVDREGWVRIQAELWRAEAREPIAAGSAVRVRSLHGHVLVVEPDAQGPPAGV